jgi:hypothetical protein
MNGILVFVGIVVAWLILVRVVLPRFGIHG